MDMGYKEDDEWINKQREKLGDYSNPGIGCTNCGRNRVMKGSDCKHRCEKCAWCIEDGEFDLDFLKYITQ
jgi:hypothetical protein